MAAVRKERRRLGRGAAAAPRRVHLLRSAHAARRAAALRRAGVFRALRIARDAGFAFYFSDIYGLRRAAAAGRRVLCFFMRLRSSA